jgi:hypothetical protein
LSVNKALNPLLKDVADYFTDVRNKESNPRNRMLVLALIMVMYIAAASHWAINISTLSMKLRNPGSTDQDRVHKGFALTLPVGMNVSSQNEEQLALKADMIFRDVDASKRLYSYQEMSCVMGA